MALEATDVFVVQKQTGGKENRKLSVQQLSDYLGSGPSVVFKGVLDITNSATQPENPSNGDLYINSAQTTGTFAWTNGTGYTGNVEPDARAIWDGTGWAVTNPPSGDVGVEKVQGALPIVVDSTTASEPIVSVNPAVTDESDPDSVVQTSGVVTIATAAQVNSSATNVVVTAKQLKDAVGQAGGGTVTGVTADAPLSVTDANTTPNITISNADSSAVGAVQLVDASVATPNTSSEALAVVPAYLSKFYLVSDFSTLNDIDYVPPSP